MKRIFHIVLLFLIPGKIFAQHVPEWTRDINVLPDTSNLFAVKTVVDDSGFVYVLSSYAPVTGSPGNKIYVTKFTDAGVRVYTFIYDNNNSGSPRGFDLATDQSGNAYVAGGLMVSPFNLILLKISPGGNLSWVRDSTTSFFSGTLMSVQNYHNYLYVSSSSGIAVFDLNGNEIWSNTISATAAHTDQSGRFIISGYSSGNNFFIFDSTGTQIHGDSTFYADKIISDNENNIYTLTDDPVYTLVKYDSSGILQWFHDSFPDRPPFGDIGFEVLTDFYKNVYAVGLNDTMFKFDQNGNLLWEKSMNGMDNYLLNAQITFLNLLAIAGAENGIGGYDAHVNIYNDQGVVNWSGNYSSNAVQEFPVSMAINNSGIFVLEDSISCSDLIKFTSPVWNDTADAAFICVDSVWYDTVNPVIIHVRVVNGGVHTFNYPFVQIIDPNGDTISNHSHNFSFFVQFGNSTQEYQDSIGVSGITDFSNYSFMFYDGALQNGYSIGLCSTTGIEQPELNTINLYPNPVSDLLCIRSPAGDLQLSLYDFTGKLIFEKNLAAGVSDLNVSKLSSGNYFIRLRGKSSLNYFRIIKN
jgi:hypothetical protein